MEKFLIGLSEQVKEKIQRFNHEISEHDEQEIIFQQVFDVLQGLESDFDSFIEENETFCFKLFDKIGIDHDLVLHYNSFAKSLKFHVDVEFQTDMIKNAISTKEKIKKEILTSLRNKLVKKRDTYRVSQLREEVENYTKALDLLWQVSNLKNMDKEQSLLLVDVLEKEISSEKDFSEVMKFLIKGRVSSHKKQVDREQSITKMIVNKKAFDVMRKLSYESQLISDSRSKVSSVRNADELKPKIDGSESKKGKKVLPYDSLSDEEKNVIEQLNNIFNSRGSSVVLTDDKIYKKLVSNVDLDIRKKLYFKDGNLDYNLIARDVNFNLRKNISVDNRDKIFEIFEFIIEEDHKYQGQIIETNKLYNKIKEALASFGSEEILDDDSDIIKKIKEEINILISNTSSLLETIQEVKGGGIDSEDLAFIETEIKESLEQYNNLKSKLVEKISEMKILEEKKALEEEKVQKETSKKSKKKKFVPLKEVISPFDISNSANILLFLENGNTDESESSLCIEDDLYAGGLKDIAKELQKQLQKAVRILSQQDINSIKNTDNRKINKLKDNELPDNRHFSKPWRLREGKSRISYVVVNLCAENREKIKMLYNIGDDFYKNGQIVLIGGSVFADNDDYDKLVPLNKEIIANEGKIRELINLFGNEAKAKELDQAIRGLNSIYVTNESSEELEKLYEEIDSEVAKQKSDKNGGKNRKGV